MSVLLISAALFSVGLYGVLVRRDIIAILASVEVMLAGPLVLLVSVAASAAADAPDPNAAAQGAVQAIGLIVLVIAAAEAAVGLALLVAVARSRRSTRLDELTEVRG